MRLKQLPVAFTQALPVLQKLRDAGFEAYFVGGAVRDALLSRPIHDVDIATSAYPAEVKALFRRTLDIGIDHGTVLVLAANSQYEVTTFRTESGYTDFRRPDHVDFVQDLSEDLKRRDFTINAFAMAPDGEIIDHFDGLSDLAVGQLRAVGLPAERFHEDALRIMRAMRFAAQMDLAIEPATLDAMRNSAPLLTKIAIERIFVEMDKLLLASHFRKGLSALTETGAWQYLPDFKEPHLSDLTDPDFTFKTSAQAWSWLSLTFGGLNLRRWKVSNDLVKAVSALTEAYQLTGWSPSSLYRYGLKTCQLADDLKIAQGARIERDIPLKLDRQLPIHHRSEIAVTGADLIAQGVKPGPRLGQLLAHIEHQIVMGDLLNTREAILTALPRL